VASTDQLPVTPEAAKPPQGSVFHRLYTGAGAFDIVGRRKWFYIFFSTLVLVGILSIVFRGFHLGIDFKGGTKIEMPAASTQGVISTDAAGKVFTDTLGYAPEVVQAVGTGASASIQIRTGTLNAADAAKVEDALFTKLQPKDRTGEASRKAISDTAVSGSWGSQITRSALIALAVFLVLVSVFLALYFERWMAVGALVALVHDLVVTAGVYSIVGFEVTPATVTGLLTILGFSLYDTVVCSTRSRRTPAACSA
jgi:preprotein translocase subunit SecF